MLEFHDPIPNLAGKICISLLAQEYWYRGERVSPANVLFLHSDDNRWHRFFIDAGVVFWRVESQPFPVAPSEGDHRYVIADLGQRHGIVGHGILGVRTVDLPGGGEIRIQFADAPLVVLRDVEDTIDLEIGSGVTPTA